MSHMAKSSRRDRVHQRLRRTVRTSAMRDQEPKVRQRVRLMGRPPHLATIDLAFDLTRPGSHSAVVLGPTSTTGGRRSADLTSGGLIGVRPLTPFEGPVGSKLLNA